MTGACTSMRMGSSMKILRKRSSERLFDDGVAAVAEATNRTRARSGLRSRATGSKARTSSPKSSVACYLQRMAYLLRENQLLQARQSEVCVRIGRALRYLRVESGNKTLARSYLNLLRRRYESLDESLQINREEAIDL